MFCHFYRFKPTKYRRSLKFIFILLLMLFMPGLSIFFANNKASAEPILNGRISTRINKDGSSEFYNTSTLSEFRPRGNSYIRVDDLPYHITFQPGLYNPAQIESALGQMEENGYNIVRVFLDFRNIDGTLTEPGVDPTYMNNVVDFLYKARNHNIYTTIAFAWLPENYYSIVRSYPAPPHEGGRVNAIFLSQRYIEAYKVYAADIVRYLKNTDQTLLDGVFSLTIWNEARYESNYDPFLMTSGTVTLADGQTYDMGSPSNRRLAADNGARHWINQVGQSVKSVDPQLMIDVSVFTPEAVGRDGYDGIPPATPENPDVRHPFRPTAFYNTPVNFIDLNLYPLGSGYSLSSDLASAEINLLPKTKPRMMGEFGAIRYYYSTVTQAAQVLKEFLASTCQYDFKGGLLWTWDSDEPGLNSIYWNALSENDNINNALAPINYPYPCGPPPSTPPSPPPPPVEITKSVNKTSASSGETLIYTITYSNPTNDSLANAKVEDALPAGTNFISASDGGSLVDSKIVWELGTVLPSQSAIVSFEVLIN